MHVASLAFRTDLALLALSGSEVEDHGEYVAVRTPDNPAFWWGNFLLLPRPPAADEVAEWEATFRRTFPAAAHRAYGVASAHGTLDDLAGFVAAGLSAEASTVMTSTAVHEPPRPNREATYRPLVTDDDWSQQVELSAAGEDPSHREFVVARTAAARRATESGAGAWWGAFDGSRLTASMGLFAAGPGLARFQEVKTRPDARGRGLAGTLVHEVSRYGFEALGAHTLVMVADPEYVAIRVYRSVGFTESETQLQASRKPA